VLLYPQVSIWGKRAAFHKDRTLRILDNNNWSPDAVETTELYADLKLRPTDARYDSWLRTITTSGRASSPAASSRINDLSFRS